jgi:hypothetical protein
VVLRIVWQNLRMTERSRPLALACLVAVLCAACGERYRQRTELTQPARGWDDEFGLCGSEYAIDGDGVVWREGGCENGDKARFHERGNVSHDQLERFVAAFAQLPEPSSEPTACDDRHTFWVRERNVERRWIVCAAPHPTGVAPADTLPAPYREVAKLFQDLGP